MGKDSDIINNFDVWTFDGFSKCRGKNYKDVDNHQYPGFGTVERSLAGT